MSKWISIIKTRIIRSTSSHTERQGETRDGMITYYNYFRITKESNPAKYEAIAPNVNDFLYCLCEAEKGADLSTLDLKKGAESYLAKGGLTGEQIAAIENYLTA